MATQKPRKEWTELQATIGLGISFRSMRNRARCEATRTAFQGAVEDIKAIRAIQVRELRASFQEA